MDSGQRNKSVDLGWNPLNPWIYPRIYQEIVDLSTKMWISDENRKFKGTTKM